MSACLSFVACCLSRLSRESHLSQLTSRSCNSPCIVGPHRSRKATPCNTAQSKPNFNLVAFGSSSRDHKTAFILLPPALFLMQQHHHTTKHTRHQTSSGCTGLGSANSCAWTTICSMLDPPRGSGSALTTPCRVDSQDVEGGTLSDGLGMTRRAQCR
jgi:hypothetical protein